MLARDIKAKLTYKKYLNKHYNNLLKEMYYNKREWKKKKSISQNSTRI